MPTSAGIASLVGPFQGRGLFGAQPARLALRRGPVGGGLVFALGRARLPASVDRVTTDTSWAGLPRGVPVRNTTLASSDGVHVVATVEHVLSALAGAGIWDAVIEIDGPETPILDGSAADFARALGAAGWCGTADATPLRLAGPIEVRDASGATITATPRERGGSFTYHLNYGPASPLRPQTASWRQGDVAEYLARVAPARTFSLEAEAAAARAAGLFAHLTPRDMLVIGPDGLPVDNAFRFPDEPARHKLLDLIGDLALLGRPLAADVIATRSGHTLAHAFCRAALAAAVKD